MVSLIQRFMASAMSDPTGGPGNDFWYNPVGSASYSGERVSVDSALTVPAVFACDRVLNNSTGAIPLVVYRRLPGNKGKERAVEHSMYRLLHDGISRHETSMDWRALMQHSLNFRGNSYTQITEWGSDGFPRAMRSLNTDQMVKIEPVTDRTRKMEVLRYTYREDDGYQQIIPSDDILHLKGQPRNRHFGMSPIQAQRELFGRAQAIDKSSSSFFRNAMRPSVVVKRPKDAPKWSDAGQARFKAEMRATLQGSENSGQVPVLEEGMELQKFSLTPEEAQWLETSGYTLERVCGIFGVPPHMVAHLLRATFSNIEHQAIDFVTHGMMPILVRWEQRLNAMFFAGDPEYFVEFIVDGLMRSDSESRGNYINQLVMNGTMTRNEARSILNLNWLQGLDEPLQPNNMAENGSKGPRPETAPKGGQRALRVVEKVAEREMRREVAQIRLIAKKHASGDESGWAAAVTEFYGATMARLQDVLEIDEAVARNYCSMRERDVIANGVGTLESWTPMELTQAALAA